MNANYLQAICYLDTNVLIYMFDDRDPVKQQQANELYLHFLTTGLGRISVQVMSEWRNAIVKKFRHLIDPDYRREFLETLQAWNPLPISAEMVIQADLLCDHYALSPYDAIHIQAALELHCQYFLSEDLQNGLVVRETLTILNPFEIH